jgi:hypothetical protein
VYFKDEEKRVLKDFSRVCLKEEEELFCLGFLSEMSLFDSSEQTDDKIKRISSKAKAFCVKQPAIIIKVFSRNQRERRREDTQRKRDRERFWPLAL